MSSDTSSTSVPAASLLPGGEVLALVRRLIITAVLAGLVYSVLSTGSRAYCPGGINSYGDFLDHLGNPTDVAPSCISMTLGPSPVVYLVLALIVVWAVTKVVKAKSEAEALRVLGWAGPSVIVAALVAGVVAQVAFFSIPLEHWDGTGPPPIPGWLAVDVVISPRQGA